MSRKLLCLGSLLAALLSCASAAPAKKTSPDARPQPHPDVQALAARGIQAQDLRRFEEALRFYNQALAKARALKDRVGEAGMLYGIGSVYDDLGQLQKALEYLNQALPLTRAVGDPVLEILTLNNLGLVYERVGQRQKARECFRQVLPLARAAGEKRVEAITLNNLGLCCQSMDELQEALDYYGQALALIQSLGDRATEATTLNNMGLVYSRLGQPLKALECFGRALPLLEAVGNKGLEAVTLNNIGLNYQSIGQLQKAGEYYHQALLLTRALKDRAKEAKALSNLGAVYQSAGQAQQALQYYQQALELVRAVGEKPQEAVILDNIGTIRQTLGEPQEAQKLYDEALLLHRSMKNRAGEATALLNLGALSATMGQPGKALDYYGQALALFRTVGDRLQEGIALGSIGAAEEAQGRRAEAVRRLREALEVFERMREALGGLAEDKAGFLRSRLGFYHFYVNLQLKHSQPGEAFLWAQKTKARALLDLMQEGKVEISQALTENERGEERRLKLELARRNQAWVQAALRPGVDEAQLAPLKQQLTQAETELQNFTEQLYIRYPHLVRKRAAGTASLQEIGQVLAEDTALLEYVILQAQNVDRLILFCVTMEAGKPVLHAYPIEQSREALAELADDFRSACADPQKNYRVKARDLYTLLVAPAARQVAGRKRLLICPDGPLWGFPFQALVLESQTVGNPNPQSAIRNPQFLIEQFEIAYAYSATAAQAAFRAKTDLRRPKATGTLLALANPEFGGEARFTDRRGEEKRPIFAEARQIFADARRDVFMGGGIKPLPGTQREADALKAQFPDAAIRTGSSAQEGTAKQEAARYRYLHFATHGIFNDAAPLMSSVVLAQPEKGSVEDGFLTAREVFDWNLGAEMVVLSACDTARGEKRPGEGVVGLTWALFVAGSPTQVLSQWAVSDDSTAELMKQFYGELKQGAAKGAALRTASLVLLKDGRHGHPYYWAPFILIGDWR
jgi:CHAT domain-containing protein/Tfp pilus assembly protein PilF